MSKVKVKIDNFKLDFVVKEKDIRKRVGQSAKIVQKEAKRLVYKDGYAHKVSGKLKRSITTRKWKRGDIGATVFHKWKKGDFFYPAIVLYGKGKTKGTKNWIADAFKNKERQLQKELSQVLKEL